MKDFVVVALDAVVARPFVVREAEQVRGQTGAGNATVDVGALRLGNLADARQSQIVQLLGHRRGDASGQVDELPRGRELRVDVGGAELEDGPNPGGDVLPLGCGDLVRWSEDGK